ncbi:MAG: hypothetical protein U1F68_08585 [Gammaproteobacteria bacterium]
MDIAYTVETAFPGSLQSTAELNWKIEENPNILELSGELNYLKLVPSYIQWCIQNKDRYDQLVTDWTIHALAEYGRAKSPESPHLNFKFLCSSEQRWAIRAFLEWCITSLEVVHEAQVYRAIRHWQ